MDRPNFFYDTVHKMLPKTKPAGDDFPLTALWLNDDDESYFWILWSISALDLNGHPLVVLTSKNFK